MTGWPQPRQIDEGEKKDEGLSKIGLAEGAVAATRTCSRAGRALVLRLWALLHPFAIPSRNIYPAAEERAWREDCEDGWEPYLPPLSCKRLQNVLQTDSFSR
jgi:hypothetical protein